MAKLIFRYYPQPLTPEEEKLEKKIFRYSLVIPVIFLIIIWMIKISELISGVHLYNLGIIPRDFSGAIGIATSPLIHADFKHLIANSTSFIVLSTALFYFYRKVALKVFILNYFIAGILLWFGGRDVTHIGASGVIYGLASFLLLSGILMRDLRLLTISLIVVFLYGSMIWGIFPIEPGISWDGHLMGAVSGILLSLLFHKNGPPTPHDGWFTGELEDDDEDDEPDDRYWEETTEEPVTEEDPTEIQNQKNVNSAGI
jgi:membrane associated rhomboid family serine protease